MDYQWLRFDMKTESNSKKEPSVSEIANVLAIKVNELWSRASIPTVPQRSIVRQIKGYHDKYKKLLWFPTSRRNEKYEQDVREFREQARKTMFDIAACKCDDFSSCNCEKSCKVPVLEQTFLQDQRSARKMMIGAVDKVTSRKLEERKKRKSQEEDRLAKYQLEASTSQAATQSSSLDSPHLGSDTEDSCSTKDESDADILPGHVDTADEGNTCSKGTKQQRRQLKNTAMASERHAVSDRAVAEIASAVLQDCGIVTPEDRSEVIDRSKVRRERQKYRSMVCADAVHSATPLQGIYFDGRKDKTVTKEMVDSTAHRRAIVEEHVSLVQEPGSNYIGHITPKSGSSSSILTAMISFLQENILICSICWQLDVMMLR